MMIKLDDCLTSNSLLLLNLFLSRQISETLFINMFEGMAFVLGEGSRNLIKNIRSSHSFIKRSPYSVHYLPSIHNPKLCERVKHLGVTMWVT